MRNGTPAAASAIASSPPRLEPQHPFACLGEFNDPTRDVGLGRRRPAAALAGKFEPRLRSRERQHTPVHECIVHDDIGMGEAGAGIKREQPGIPRPRACKPDMTSIENREPHGQRCENVPLSHRGHVR